MNGTSCDLKDLRGTWEAACGRRLPVAQTTVFQHDKQMAVASWSSLIQSACPKSRDLQPAKTSTQLPCEASSSLQCCLSSVGVGVSGQLLHR